MIVEIITQEGETYKFDPETERIFKDGFLLPGTAVEPVYSDINGATSFSGILLKATNQIVTLSGTKNSVVDNVNSIQ